MTLNAIFFDADGRLRPVWRAFTFVPLYLLLLIVFSIAAGAIIGHDTLHQNLELTLGVGGVASLLAALLPAKLCLRFLDRRDFRTLGLWFYPGWAWQLAGGLAAGLVLISLVVGGQWLSGGVRFVALAASGPVLLGAALWNLVVLLPAAAGEELLFRGYPFQRLIEACGAWPATFLCAALFGVLHLRNPSPTALSTLNTSLMGVVLALAYLKSCGLWLPIGLHFAWNYALGFLYSLPVSGLRLEGSLWQVEVAGPRWLTGGAYGPEGSLVSTVIALTAIVGFARSDFPPPQTSARMVSKTAVRKPEVDAPRARPAAGGDRAMRSRTMGSASLVAGLLLCFAAPTAAAADSRPAKLSPENRLGIVRQLAFEYAVTRKPLPAGKVGLELNAKGEVDERKLRQQLANHGAAVPTGDTIQVTAVEFQDNRIIFEINGGGRGRKKKWHQRVQVSVGGPGGTVPITGRPSGDNPSPSGSTIVLRFPGPIPDLTPEEVRGHLSAVLDFSSRTASIPWIETLPEEFQQAIREKRAALGMNREMVLAALGRPDHKVRETRDTVEEEDWIYGQPPFVTFVTFVGDQVIRVKEFK